MDLEDLAPDLTADADRTTKRGKDAATKARVRAAQSNGAQRGANTMALKFRNAPITLPTISTQKRKETA